MTKGKIEDDPVILFHLNGIDGRGRSHPGKGGERENGGGKKRFHGKLELGKGLSEEANKVTVRKESRFG